jgi:hypothetical protein
MSISGTLVLVQQVMTRYILSAIVVFGNLGHFILIGILSQKRRRLNSCSIYILAASVFGLIIINWAIIPLVYALDHIDPLGTSLVLCRIRGYIIHTSSMSFRYIIVLACIDRYAMCSSRISIRNFCRPRIAYCLIAIITIFWTIVCVHLLIFESIQSGRCGVYGLYGFIYSIYSIVCFGAIPTSLMIVFGLLLMNKLRKLRSRVQPFHTNFHLRRFDSSLGKVIVVEVIVSIVCTFNHPLMTFYLTLTNYIIPNKSSERLQIESFVNFITMSLLLYLNYSTPFYVYFFTSKSFRKSVKQLIVKCTAVLKYDIRNTGDGQNS